MESYELLVLECCGFLRTAGDVHEWINSEAAERIYLIGHSHGGLLAAMAAMLRLLLLAIGAGLRRLSGDGNPGKLNPYRRATWIVAPLILVGSIARFSYLLNKESAPPPSAQDGELMALSLLIALIVILGAFPTDHVVGIKTGTSASRTSIAPCERS